MLARPARDIEVMTGALVEKICRGPSASSTTSPTSPIGVKIFSRLAVQLQQYEELRTGRTLNQMSLANIEINGDDKLAETPSTPTRSLGFYRLGAELAQGSTGDVFAAVIVQEGKYTQVAAKRVRITTSASKRRNICKEIETAYLTRMRGGHENIIQYLDWLPGLDGVDREIFLIMERCDFGLDDLIRPLKETRAIYERRAKSSKDAVTSPSVHRFAEKEIMKLCQEMVSALAFLNSIGVIHQDVKTENILWKHGDFSGGVYKLCDFGIMVVCKNAADDPRLTVRPTGRPGTLWTMAPEVIRGLPRDAAVDIWSLGCVIYEQAFLDKPFNSLELMTFQNEYSAILPELFPKKTTTAKREEDIKSSPPKMLIKTPQRCSSVTNFSKLKPLPRYRQKWIYSQELKELLCLCFVTEGRKRMTPTEILKCEEYALALKAATEGDCRAIVTSEDFYRASIKQHRHRKQRKEQMGGAGGHTAAEVNDYEEHENERDPSLTYIPPIIEAA